MPEERGQMGRSLPDEINIATRSLHTTLNRLITTRLPLALPPNASNPTLYTIGLLHFSHIYLTFESLWTDLSAPSNAPTSPLLSFLLVDPWDADTATTVPPPSPQTLEFLRNLRPRGLARSPRLKRDLEVLTGLKGTDLDVKLAQFPGVKVQEFCAHIRASVKARPHVLIAYAWCFYMAIFSGGRWIRSELRQRGTHDFWRNGDVDAQEKSRPLDEAGLSLWYFDGAEDGEDIKAEFKKRLSEAEDLFSPQQREEVVQEAKSIFRLSAGLVGELDEKLATDFEKLAEIEAAERHRPRGEKKEVVEQSTIRVHREPGIRPWFSRPEIVGSAFALSCFAWMAVTHFSPSYF